MLSLLYFHDDLMHVREGLWSEEIPVNMMQIAFVARYSYGAMVTKPARG